MLRNSYKMKMLNEKKNAIAGKLEKYHELFRLKPAVMFSSERPIYVVEHNTPEASGID